MMDIFSLSITGEYVTTCIKPGTIKSLRVAVPVDRDVGSQASRLHGLLFPSRMMVKY
jgi:hypothetical protein